MKAEMESQRMVILQGEEQGPQRNFLISRLGKVRVKHIQKDFMVLKSWGILRNYGNMPEKHGSQPEIIFTLYSETKWVITAKSDNK